MILAHAAPTGGIPESAQPSGGEAGRPDEGRHPRTRRRALWLAGVVTIAAVGTAAALQWIKPDGRIQAADSPAPGFELPRLGQPGSTISLDELRGRPVVLNFWASWCVPCAKEMPELQAVYDKVGSRVAFVGINHQDGRTGALDMVAKTGVRYPSGYDPEGKTAIAYGLRGLPSTVFISADGRVLEKRIGELSREELAQAVEELFPPG